MATSRRGPLARAPGCRQHPLEPLYLWLRPKLEAARAEQFPVTAAAVTAPRLAPLLPRLQRSQLEPNQTE